MQQAVNDAHFQTAKAALQQLFQVLARQKGREKKIHHLIHPNNISRIAAANPATEQQYLELDLKGLSINRRKGYWQLVDAVLRDVEHFMEKKRTGAVARHENYVLDQSSLSELIVPWRTRSGGK